MPIILKAESKTSIKHGYSNWFWTREEDAGSLHSHRPSAVGRSMTRWRFHIDLLFISLPWVNFCFDPLVILGKPLIIILNSDVENCSVVDLFVCWLKLIAFSFCMFACSLYEIVLLHFKCYHIHNFPCSLSYHFILFSSRLCFHVYLVQYLWVIIVL